MFTFTKGTMSPEQGPMLDTVHAPPAFLSSTCIINCLALARVAPRLFLQLWSWVITATPAYSMAKRNTAPAHSPNFPCGC